MKVNLKIDMEDKILLALSIIFQFYMTTQRIRQRSSVLVLKSLKIHVSLVWLSIA